MAPIVVSVMYGTRYHSGIELDTNDAIGAVKHKIFAQMRSVPQTHEMMLYFSGKLLLDHASRGLPNLARSDAGNEKDGTARARRVN
ncbi:hypothetical protein niasHS_001054 [Heterodera schachtii]|uniref:Ubiquitin-like domain-containing protein n=1 Tax=Heterodera schachtii TaxID=97005 RepID=A0ABD2K8I0_HETSC